jgi:Carboxypeptidase regulatory-like domain
MRIAHEILAALPLTALVSAAALGASITGTVTGPDGKPFMGTFVAAENPQSQMTVNVLSDAQGHYRITNLPGATYTVCIEVIGYTSEPRGGVALAVDAMASLDFGLQKTPVRWSDLSTYQGRQLLPKSKNHDLSYKDSFFTTCFQSCHSFQKRMATQSLDLDGWRTRVRYMSDTMLEGRHLSDATVEDFASYLNTMFGTASPKLASPEELPQYKSLVRPGSTVATNIVYVEYDFAADNGMGPWSAVEDKEGKLWIPYYGRGNEVVRLDPGTRRADTFPLPFPKLAATGIHSVIPTPDGTVWFTELAVGRIGHLDPSTRKVTEYQNTPLPDGRRTTAHTVRVDAAGRVWASGGPAISMFDPKYERCPHARSVNNASSGPRRRFDRPVLLRDPPAEPQRDSRKCADALPYVAYGSRHVRLDQMLWG